MWCVCVCVREWGCDGVMRVYVRGWCVCACVRVCVILSVYVTG